MKKPPTSNPFPGSSDGPCWSPLIRIFLGICVLLIALPDRAEAQQRRKKKKVAATPSSILGCPDEGRGGDSNLNRRKNIRSDNQRATLRTIPWMKNLADPRNFTRQSPNRNELTRLGEGKKITVVAYALVARKGGKESCNCGLSAVKDADNHIVLVDPTIKKPTLKGSEGDSVTAEFTPRVRLDHPNLARAKLQPLIEPRDRRLVRVTGLLLFDSEHFFGHHLKRHNNWEVHPVLKLEYCVAATCEDTGAAGWKSLD
jgi:hypothetical protein